MSCGLEAYVLALKLATELVKPEYINNPRTTLAVCDCGCAGSESERLFCEASRAASREIAAKEHNDNLREFQQMVRMCDPATAKEVMVPLATMTIDDSRVFRFTPKKK